MIARLTLLSVTALAAMGLGLTGCEPGTGAEIDVAYPHPNKAAAPLKEKSQVVLTTVCVPPSMDELGQWPNRAMNMILEVANREAKGRFEVKDRSNDAIVEVEMRQKKSQLGPEDYDKIMKLASDKKIAADYLIVGQLGVSTERRNKQGASIVTTIGTLVGIDVHTQKNTFHKVWLTLHVIEVDTRKTRVINVQREVSNYDARGWRKAMGLDGDVSNDTLIEDLLGGCVRNAVQQALHPEQKLDFFFTHLLQNKETEPGDLLAREEKYAEALAEYRKVLAQKPEDHAALFNAGLMCEVLSTKDTDRDKQMARLQEARGHYIRLPIGTREYQAAVNRVTDQIRYYKSDREDDKPSNP